MAMHFTEAAALLQMQAAKKLVLMACADSADKDTRVAIPGFDTIMQWSGLRRAQAYAAITELVAEGYLARKAAGRSGRRAEFYVFPRGACCPLHGPLPGYEEQASDDEVKPQDSAESGSTPPESAPRLAVVPDQPAEDVQEPGPSTTTSGSGSGSGTGSSLDRTPSRLPGSKNPPNPPASRGERCRHRRSNCRQCGTNPRAERQTELVALQEHERQRAAVRSCGSYRCDPGTRRIHDPDTGMPSKCPECHPDLVVGPSVAHLLPSSARRQPEPRHARPAL